MASIPQPSPRSRHTSRRTVQLTQKHPDNAGVFPAPFAPTLDFSWEAGVGDSLVQVHISGWVPDVFHGPALAAAGFAEVLQTTHETFCRVEGCDTIAQPFSGEDTAPMRSLPSACGAISASL